MQAHFFKDCEWSNRLYVRRYLDICVDRGQTHILKDDRISCWLLQLKKEFVSFWRSQVVDRQVCKFDVESWTDKSFQSEKSLIYADILPKKVWKGNILAKTIEYQKRKIGVLQSNLVHSKRFNWYQIVEKRILGNRGLVDHLHILDNNVLNSC